MLDILDAPNTPGSLFSKEYSIFAATPRPNKKAPNPAAASLGVAGSTAHPSFGRGLFRPAANPLQPPVTKQAHLDSRH